MKSLSGWHRLYIVTVLVWAGIIALQLPGMMVREPAGWEGDLLRTAALVWFLTSLALLAVGYGIAWAIRGFRK